MADEPVRRSARPQLLLIALVFFGPLVVAAWMYYGGHFNPTAAGSNNGALLHPVVNLNDSLPDAGRLSQGKGQWLLLYSNE